MPVTNPPCEPHNRIPLCAGCKWWYPTIWGDGQTRCKHLELCKWVFGEGRRYDLPFTEEEAYEEMERHNATRD